MLLQAISFIFPKLRHDPSNSCNTVFALVLQVVLYVLLNHQMGVFSAKLSSPLGFTAPRRNSPNNAHSPGCLHLGLVYGIGWSSFLMAN